MLLLDDTPWGIAAGLLENRLIVVTSERRIPMAKLALEMSPWGEDDWIEYLLHRHRDRCKSVMQRLRGVEGVEALGGLPWFWAIVLDAFAADEAARDVREVLKGFLVERLGEWRFAASQRCYEEIVKLHADESVGSPARESAPAVPGQVEGLLHHRIMKVLLAADYLALQDIAGRHLEPLHRRLCRRTCCAAKPRGICRRIREHANCWWRLWRSWPSSSLWEQSLLLAADAAWQPASRITNLYKAQLSRAKWSGVRLSRAILTGVNLNNADLMASNMHAANLSGACVSAGADLTEADYYGDQG